MIDAVGCFFMYIDTQTHIHTCSVGWLFWVLGDFLTVELLNLQIIMDGDLENPTHVYGAVGKWVPSKGTKEETLV